jgi:hypothetical protein
VAPIFSQLFVSAHGIDVGDVLPLPFAGTGTYVLRDVSIFVVALGPVTAQMYDNFDATFFQLSEADAGGGFWAQWQGRQVFRPGDTLFFTATSLGGLLTPGTFDVRASGYALSP